MVLFVGTFVAAGACVFDGFGAAFAAGKAKGKAKDNGNENGNGAENGNAGGNGNGNGNAGGNGNGNGNANGSNNGITNGNGLAIGLGDGVGIGVGVGDDNTIGVGLGLSVGDEKNQSRSLEDAENGRNGPRWEKSDRRDDWRANDAHGGAKKDDPDLGQQFSGDRIQKALRPDFDDLGKLLGHAENADTRSGADHTTGVQSGTNDGRDPRGHAKSDTKPDHAQKAAKESKSNGKALGHDKEKHSNNGKALGKNKKNDEEDSVQAPSSNPPADPQNAGGGSNVAIAPGSYVDREVLAVGLQPAAMTRIRQLGFSISDNSLEQERGALLTLSPPDGLGALRSIALLRRELPRESFYLNRIYRPYNPATEDSNEKDREPSDKSDAPGKCTGDRCFGRAAIGWGDRVADCARGVNVGVIDTDVDLAHPAFAGQKITRKSFLSEGRKSSGKGHGTSVLALLAGGRDSSTPGLIPQAQFFFADIFFTDENGDTMTDTVSLLKALQWMESSQTRVVNMSFSGPEDELVQVRLKAMRARGIAFTAAAGNQGPAAAPSYPAAYSEVIAVTAVDKNMRVYPFANRGPYVDVAAPGVKIWTAVAGAREEYRTGTSFAAPFATAIIAVQQPDTLNEADEQLLDHMQTVELGPRGRDQTYGRGLLKAPHGCSSDLPIAVSAPAALAKQR